MRTQFWAGGYLVLPPGPVASLPPHPGVSVSPGLPSFTEEEAMLYETLPRGNPLKHIPGEGVALGYLVAHPPVLPLPFYPVDDRGRALDEASDIQFLLRPDRILQVVRQRPLSGIQPVAGSMAADERQPSCYLAPSFPGGSFLLSARYGSRHSQRNSLLKP